MGSYNSRPFHRRGWGICEAVLALEIHSRARAYYPMVDAWLSSLPVAKAYSVNEVGDANEMSIERPRQRRAIAREINSAIFTFPQDRQRVVHMYNTRVKQIVAAFEQAEATREHALLEASKGQGEYAVIARKELSEHRKRLKDVFGDVRSQRIDHSSRPYARSLLPDRLCCLLAQSNAKDCKGRRSPSSFSPQSHRASVKQGEPRSSNGKLAARTA